MQTFTTETCQRHLITEEVEEVKMAEGLVVCILHAVPAKFQNRILK